MRKLLPIAALAVAASIVLVGCNAAPASQTNSTSTDTTASGAAGINGSPNQNNTGTPTSGGNAKSQYWPADMPTLDAGYNFNYAKISDTYSLSYQVSADKDAQSIANDIKALITGAGWTTSTDGTMESDNVVLQVYTKSGNTMELTVGKDDNTTNIYTIAMVSGPSTQTGQ